MNKTYLCDPARNTACNKALCFLYDGPCGTTDDVRFALRDFLGDPVEIVDEEFGGINDNIHHRQEWKEK